MSGHTPGPWKVQRYLRPDLDDDPMGVYLVETAADALTPRYYEAEPETPELDAVHSENEANARLIAAAPDLLAALEKLVRANYGQPSGVTVPALDQARAAIAQAKGEAGLDTCSDCGAQVTSIIGCPDGAEICQACFDKGAH